MYIHTYILYWLVPKGLFRVFACRECRLRRLLQLQEKLLKGGDS